MTNYEVYLEKANDFVEKLKQLKPHLNTIQQRQCQSMIEMESYKIENIDSTKTDLVDYALETMRVMEPWLNELLERYEVERSKVDE